MSPQLRLGKVFTVTVAEVPAQQRSSLHRLLPLWIQNWLDFYINTTCGSHEPFFISGFYIPQMDLSRVKFCFCVGGVDFQDEDKHFVKRAFNLANRLDEDLKCWARQEFSEALYAWCLPQFNQFEFN